MPKLRKNTIEQKEEEQKMEKKWEKKKLEYLHRHIHKKITVNFRIERIIHLTDAIQRGIS
jgi:hypothetical protein